MSDSLHLVFYGCADRRIRRESTAIARALDTCEALASLDAICDGLLSAYQ